MSLFRFVTIDSSGDIYDKYCKTLPYRLLLRKFSPKEDSDMTRTDYTLRINKLCLNPINEEPIEFVYFNHIYDSAIVVTKNWIKLYDFNDIYAFPKIDLDGVQHEKNLIYRDAIIFRFKEERRLKEELQHSHPLEEERRVWKLEFPSRKITRLIIDYLTK